MYVDVLAMENTDLPCSCGASCTCNTYDAIVIGAGIMGSSTAYNLRKKGKKTLLLEQFPLPHTRGSSHGASRIIRTAYPEPFQAAIMPESFKLWRELAGESNMQLFQKTGLLVFGRKSIAATELEDYSRSIKEPTAGLMDNHQLARKFPLMNFYDDSIGCHEQAAGFLYADRAISAFQRLFVQRGGHLKDNEKVLQVVPGAIIQVITNKEKYKTRGLALCCGGWATQLLPTLDIHIPLQCEGIDVCYWRTKADISHVSLPVFIVSSAPGEVHAYGMPAIEYPGMMKICAHGGVNCSPDTRDDIDQQKRQSIMESMKALVSHTFPYLDSSQPVIMERCMYTRTPDNVCVADRHEAYPNIVYTAGFSGSGFKMAPVIGCILTDFLTNETPRFNVPQFRARRFKPGAKL